MMKSEFATMSQRSRKAFQQLVTLPDGAVPLAEAALLMACEEYPQLEISPYIDRLDEIAADVQSRMRAGDTPANTIDRMNEVLFGVLGFHGNTEDYFDPRNSFFNDVLERRTGVPITLSVVYLEVARRLRLPVAGVGMPGHFLVKYRDGDQEIFLDPFNRGEILTRDNCRERLLGMYGEGFEFSDRLLDTVSPRRILSRMLNNLKAIYLNAEAFDKGLAMVEMMLLADPDNAEQYRDRGLLRRKMRQFAGARRDLNHYLNAVPEAADRGDIEEHIKELKRIQALMN
jgi:regulator of sirC expression with transglutaminase-like and TPR domain